MPHHGSTLEVGASTDLWQSLASLTKLNRPRGCKQQRAPTAKRLPLLLPPNNNPLQGMASGAMRRVESLEPMTMLPQTGMMNKKKRISGMISTMTSLMSGTMMVGTRMILGKMK